MKQNNFTELFGYSFDKIYSENGPQTPSDPKSWFFPDFPGRFLSGAMHGDVAALEQRGDGT